MVYSSPNKLASEVPTIHTTAADVACTRDNIKVALFLASLIKETSDMIKPITKKQGQIKKKERKKERENIANKGKHTQT